MKFEEKSRELSSVKERVGYLAMTRAPALVQSRIWISLPVEKARRVLSRWEWTRSLSGIEEEGRTVLWREIEGLSRSVRRKKKLVVV